MHVDDEGVRQVDRADLCEPDAADAPPACVARACLSFVIGLLASSDLLLQPADSPGPKYFPKAPAVTGLAGGFATERFPSKATTPQRELPHMEGIFGLGCSVEEHIL